MNHTALSYNHANHRNSHHSSIVPVSHNDVTQTKENFQLSDQFDLVDSLLDKVLLNGMEGIRAAIAIAKSLEEEEHGLQLRIDQKRIKELSEMDHDALQDLQQTAANLVESIPKRGCSLIKKYYVDLHDIPETKLLTSDQKKKYGYEQWLKNRIELNVTHIWDDYMGVNDLIKAEKDFLRTTKLTIVGALANMVNGNYVKTAWNDTEDPAVLANVVVSINANLALTGALIVTLAFPVYTAIAPEDYTNEDIGMVVYTYGVVGCGVFESVSLLVAVRNMIAVNLLKPENLKELSPMGFNVVGITSLLIGLLAFGYRNMGDMFLMIFLLVIVLPGLVFIFGISSVGIMHIFEVQPWDLSGGSVDSSSEDDFIEVFRKDKEFISQSEKVKVKRKTLVNNH